MSSTVYSCRFLVKCAILTAYAVAGLQFTSVQAQVEYPSKAIRLIVPNPPGGFPDTVARVFAQKLGERLGQPVLVDNRPGANGVVAAQVLASSPKDGHTFLVTDGSIFSVNPAIYKNHGYDYKRDFTAVSLMARTPMYLAVNSKVSANTLMEFISLVKANPGKLNYGSSGIGSTHHLGMEALKTSLGLTMTHVPFKGSGQSVPALIGGQVEVLFSSYPALAGFVKSGQAKVLATSALQRSSQTPNIPAISEVVLGFDFAPIAGVFAAKDTPTVFVDRISSEIERIARLTDVIKTLELAGIEPVGSSPADHEKAVLAENAAMIKIIATAGIKGE